MVNYKLAIFDWDGTILDSIKLIVDSIHLSANDLGLPILKDQTVKNIIGLKLDHAISKLYPNLSSEQLALFLAKYADHFIRLEKDPPHLYPNVLKTLTTLRNNGYFLAIATGKNRHGLNRILDRLNLNDFFDATRCADETAGKPNPKMLYELLNYFNLSNKQAIMVGDASFDLQMANNANMDSIAVSYGAQEIETLKRYAPTNIIDDFFDLLQYLVNP